MLAKDFGLENEFEEEEVVDHCYPRKEPKYEPFEEEAEVKKRKGIPRLIFRFRHHTIHSIGNHQHQMPFKMAIPIVLNF
jgi:hypothetical protein